MPKFRKKPVVVEAFQIPQENEDVSQDMVDFLNCKTNMIEWNYNTDEAPKDGTEFLADDGFKTFTVIYHKHKNPYSNGLFARSSCGCKINIATHGSEPEYHYMFFQKWMNLPK